MIDVLFLLRGKVSVVPIGRPGLEEDPAHSQYLGQERRILVDVGTETIEHLENDGVEFFRFGARLDEL